MNNIEAPPGMTLVTDGLILEGDYFYETTLGVWMPVPRSGWNTPRSSTWTAVARGTPDMSQVDTSRLGPSQ